MQITFCGAAKGVTGSCHLLDTGKKKILLDCGMFQGSNFNEGKNFDSFIFDPKEIDAVLVTHAHLDHVGRLPKLVKDGFNKTSIFMTKATLELAELVWHDACEIMRYNHKKFQEPVLFDSAEISATRALCVGIDYHQTIDLGDGVSAVWKEAGHIFGSAFLEIDVKSNSSTIAQGKKIVFSGDIGNVGEPIVRDTEALPDNVDLLLCESTYGDRYHEPVHIRKNLVSSLFREAYQKGGTLMIPSFSLERTQELLYELNQLSEYDKTLPSAPIFLDSPLAIDATKVYEKHPEYYDAEAEKLHLSGDDFLNFPQLRLTYTTEQSKAINQIPGQKTIIAGAGMMNGGRILHHAFRYLSDPASTLLIIGYQAQGTLGRRLYEGAKKVKVFGQEIKVNCTVKAIGALSAHADQKKLLDWVGSSPTPPKQVYCVHGEEHAATELAHRLRDKYSISALVPEEGETVEI